MLDHAQIIREQKRDLIKINQGLIETMLKIIKNPKTPPENKDKAKELVLKFTQEIREARKAI